MELNLGTAPLSDDAVLKAFEACQLDPAKFRHDDHIRLAWLCVQRYGAREAEAKLLDGLRRFAQRAGVPQKFLHTTTIAWARLVAARQMRSQGNQQFEDWIVEWPELLNKNLLDLYYSSGKLESPQARHGWLDPDLKPLD